MKRLSFAATAAFLVAIAAPLGAQQLTAKSYDFIHAVEQRNGDKATEILNDNPPGIVNSRNSDGDTALIIIDTLTTPDTARSALELYYQHRPKKPVGTVILSHIGERAR